MRRATQNLELDNYMLKGLGRFVYLGADLNDENQVGQETNNRIMDYE